MHVHIIETVEGKFVGQARKSVSRVAVYESAEYVTKQMAAADVKCWIAFNTEETKPMNFDIDENDVVETAWRDSDGIPSRVWSGIEFGQMIQRFIAEYPSIKFTRSQVYNGRRAAGSGDFFLTMKLTPTMRSNRAFYIRKG